MAIILYRTPQRRDEVCEYVVSGELLTINGAEFDLSGVSLPLEIQSDFVPVPVFRLNGDVHVQLIAPYGMDGDPVDHEELPAFPLAASSPPPLTARQLRLGLVSNGITLEAVEGAIAGIESGQARDIARIEWEYASQFNRDHPLIAQVGQALGLTDSQIDVMWAIALTL